MKKTSPAAFTLVELLVVMSIVALLAGMIAGVSRYAREKGYRSRTAGEIQALSSACESYKVDNGVYPREIDGSTDILSPKADFIPTDAKYSSASLFLYMELMGDRVNNAAPATLVPDGLPDAGAKHYLRDMDPRILKATRDPTTKVITSVSYFKDPYGHPYAYSTAAVKAEQGYELALKQGTVLTDYPAGRPSGATLPGFNIGSFDLWSTGNSKPAANPVADTDKDKEWSTWVKNW